MNNAIALGVKPIEVEDPISSYAKVAQVRNMIQQGQIHAQQQQIGAETLRKDRLANAATEKQQQEHANLTAAVNEAGGNLQQGRDLFVKRGGDPLVAVKFDDELNKAAKSFNELDSAKKAKVATQHTAIDDALNVAASQPAETQVATANAKIAQLLRDGLIDKEHVPQITDAASLQQARIASTSMHSIRAEADALEKRQKATADAAKAAREEAQGPAALAKLEAEAGGAGVTTQNKKLQQAVSQLSQVGSQAEYDFGRNRLTQSDPSTAALLPAKFDRAKLLALGQTPNEQITSAQTAARDANTAENEAAIRAQGERRLAIAANADTRAQHVYDQTYGAGANPALATVDPKLRVQAAGKAAKAADDYAKGQAASADMQSLLDLARSGNKLAYRMIPVEGVLEVTTPRGTVRINKQELDAYGGAGSFLDRMEGHVGKFLTGASIPGDVLKDIEAAHKHLAEGVAGTYNQKLKGINEIYKSDFKPVPGRQSEGGMIRARDTNGKLHEAPAGTKLPAGWKQE